MSKIKLKKLIKESEGLSRGEKFGLEEVGEQIVQTHKRLNDMLFKYMNGLKKYHRNHRKNPELAEKIYNFLTDNKIDVLMDDTDEHLSAKFKKFDLIGIPNQIILGSKSSDNKFEFKEINGETKILSLEEIKSILLNKRNLN